MEKFQRAEHLIVFRLCLATGHLITSLQECHKHYQFALQFLFAALHAQQPQPLFQSQAPLHRQDTSTDPWSYLTMMANFNGKKLMYE